MGAFRQAGHDGETQDSTHREHHKGHLAENGWLCTCHRHSSIAEDTRGCRETQQPHDCLVAKKKGDVMSAEIINSALHRESPHTSTLLEVRDLATEFNTPRGPLRAVGGVSLTLQPGETLGVVGESGSGKSVLGKSIMGLISNGPSTKITGSVWITGHEVHKLNAVKRRSLWGKEVAMVFQDPMTSLSPLKNIGAHLRAPLRLDTTVSRRDMQDRSVELLRQVGLPDPGRRLKQYPHELSGGMRQRVVIAMALACKPRLLIADEPTTALDATVQKQILDLLASLSDQLEMGMILVSHDLEVVRGRTDKIAVMYGGKIVETTSTRQFFRSQRHPYSAALLTSAPKLNDTPHSRLLAIEGSPPEMIDHLPGCSFSPRCGHSTPRCNIETPELTGSNLPTGKSHAFACHNPMDLIEDPASEHGHGW